MKTLKESLNVKESRSDKIEKTFNAVLECTEVSHRVSSDIDDYDSFDEFSEGKGETHTESHFELETYINEERKRLIVDLEWDFYDNYGDLRLKNVSVSMDGDSVFPFTAEDVADICYRQYQNGTWNTEALSAWNDPENNLYPETLFDSIGLEKLKDEIIDAYYEEFN